MMSSQRYFDDCPSLFILPILSLKAAKAWKTDEPYDALVVCRIWDHKNSDTPSAYSFSGVTKDYEACSFVEISQATAALRDFMRGLAWSVTSLAFQSQTRHPRCSDNQESVTSIVHQLQTDDRVKVPKLKRPSEPECLRVAKTRFSPEIG